MKKISSIVVLIIIIGCGCGLTESAQTPVSQGCMQGLMEKPTISLEELYPAMTDPITIQLRGESEEYPAITLLNTPAEFSWTNYDGKDLTTPAKNQGRCGSCWAFSALGAFESVINIREGFTDIDIDLSEQYLLSCLPAAGSCSGGRTASPFSFIINTTVEGNFVNGVIFENCLPYEGDDGIPCSQKAEHWLDTLVPLSGFGEAWFEADDANAIAMMKSKIYENGPIYTLMLVDNSFRYFGSIFHRSTDYFPYRLLDVDFWNHAVLIVGWKDDSRIRHGGYWICKNTWGTEWGYNGFFNIEYGAMGIQTYMAWPEYDPTFFDCPPVADAGGFYQGTAGETFVFDGSCSYDAEDEDLEYFWDFGDGTTGEGCLISHVYSQSGTYSLQLTVTDGGNKSSSDSTLVFIDEEPLVVDCSDGNGITIEIRNSLQIDVMDSLLSLDISGSYQNMDYREEHIDCISAGDSYLLTLPIIGFGRGTLHLDFKSIEMTRQFISIGPFVYFI